MLCKNRESSSTAIKFSLSFSQNTTLKKNFEKKNGFKKSGLSSAVIYSSDAKDIFFYNLEVFTKKNRAPSMCSKAANPALVLKHISFSLDLSLVLKAGREYF
jgi:hypothetical protein